jgi:hemerythrin-like domain-containing protein
MYLVEDHLRPSKVIAILSKAQNCYNEMEYQAFDNIMDIILRFCYDTIGNPHHDPSNKNY